MPLISVHYCHIQEKTTQGLKMIMLGIFLLLQTLCWAQAELQPRVSEAVCDQTDSTIGNNTLGTCGCDGQLFVGEECSKAKKLLIHNSMHL